MRSTRERAMVNSFPMFPLVTMKRAIGLAFLFSLSSLLYVLFFPSHPPMDSFTSYKGKQKKKKIENSAELGNPCLPSRIISKNWARDFRVRGSKFKWIFPTFYI